MPSAVAVIGARGYIGSTIAEALECDFRVTRLAREPRSPDERAFDFWSDDLLPLIADAEAVVLAARVHPTAGDRTDLDGLAARVRHTVDACGERPLVVLSTDAVFRGDRGLYCEDEPPQPVTWYGRCSRIIEEVVMQSARRGCVVRPSYVYGHGAVGLDRRLRHVLSAVEERRSVDVYRDMFRSPIEVGDLARVIRAILASGTVGIVHAGGPRISTAQFYAAGLAALGVATDVLTERALPVGATQPDTSLVSHRIASELGFVPRPVDEALSVGWVSR